MKIRAGYLEVILTAALKDAVYELNEQGSAPSVRFHGKDTQELYVKERARFKALYAPLYAEALGRSGSETEPMASSGSREFTEEMFVERCNTLLERDGKLSSAMIGPFPVSNALVYHSPGLSILRGPQGDMEILVRYYYVNDKSEQKIMENPVFARGRDGNVYRSHGDYRYAERRLQRLLAGERIDTAIVLDKEENGWTCGTD